MDQTNSYLTRAQVAKRLQVSVSTVGNLVNSGELYAARVGRQVRIPEAALNAYLAGEQYPAPEPISEADWTLTAPTPSLFADPQAYDDARAMHYATELARSKGWTTE